MQYSKWSEMYYTLYIQQSGAILQEGAFCIVQRVEKNIRKELVKQFPK